MAAGSVARNFLRQVFGIEVLSHVIPSVPPTVRRSRARYSDLPAMASPVRGVRFGIIG